MKVYRIYEHPELGRRTVKEGFSWPGFFFTAIWALWKRLWVIGLFLFTLGVCFNLVWEWIGGPRNHWTTVAFIGASGVLTIITGVFGNIWVAQKLERTGFQFVRFVRAQNRRKAIQISLEAGEASEPVILPPFRRYGPVVLVGSLLVSLVVLKAVTSNYFIPSPSMLNTFQISDRAVIFRHSYTWSAPKVGDLVVFFVPESIPHYDPDKPIWIKRIVGVGGDRVAIEEGRLVINGNRVEDPPFFRMNPYLDRLQNGESFEETLVPEGHVLVFGDNSANSYDSRYWGSVPEENLIGKAVFRFWPPSRFGRIEDESVRPFPPSMVN